MQGVVAGQDAPVGRLLAEERLSTHEVALDRGEAHGEGGQGRGHDGDLPAFGVDPRLVSVEGQGRFQPEGVPRAQATGNGSFLNEMIPEKGALFGGDEQLEAEGFTGVSRAAEQHSGAGHRHDGELVAPGLRKGPRLEQPGNDRARLRTLEREQDQLLGTVAHDHRAGSARPVGPRPSFRVRPQVGPVFLPVGRVDHQQVLVLDEAVEVGVVDRAAGSRGNERVLGLAYLQSGGIVAQNMLQEGKRTRAADGEAPHVGDVEQAGGAPRGQVLGDHSGGIHEGHVPAAEVHHLGAEGDVLVV